MCSGRLERPTSSTSGWPLCLIGVRAPGASDWPRTSCLPFTRRMLCRVSYRGVATPPTRVRQGAPGRESPGLSRQPPKTRTIFHVPVAISGWAPDASPRRASAAAGQRLELRSTGPEPAVLPLDDPAMCTGDGVRARTGLPAHRGLGPACLHSITPAWCAARITISGSASPPRRSRTCHPSVKSRVL